MNVHVPAQPTPSHQEDTYPVKGTDVKFLHTISSHGYGLDLCTFMTLSCVFLSQKAEARIETFYVC